MKEIEFETVDEGVELALMMEQWKKEYALVMSVGDGPNGWLLVWAKGPESELGDFCENVLGDDLEVFLV